MFINSAYAATKAIPATDVAVRWDSLYDFLVWLSVFFFILIVGGMLGLIYKYRASKHPKASYITGSHMLETIWTIIPTILLLAIFGWGYVVYNDMTRAPRDAMEIRVVAKQWLWQFQYEDGRMTTNELFVPINTPVKLVMSSQDVLHDFFVPNFRIKQDVVPGMYTSVWFQATVPGAHQVFCAEYCGTSHSGMLAKLYVLEPSQWEAWKKGKKLGVIPRAGGELDTFGQPVEAFVPPAVGTAGPAVVVNESTPARTLADQGKDVSEKKGCIACHSSDGSNKTGPTFKGLYGKSVEMADGTKVTADDNYIRESIYLPQAKVVKNYSPIMPTFKGQVDDIEMNALVAYIKSLGNSAASPGQKGDIAAANR